MARRKNTGEFPATPRARAAEPVVPDENTRLNPRAVGLGVSPGVAIGPVYILERSAVNGPQRHVSPAEVEGELNRLHDAIDKSVTQLQRLEDTQNDPIGAEQAMILQAYVLMLRDPALVDATETAIRGERMNAEWALRRVASGLKASMEGLPDEYFRERAHDVDFVAERVMRNLLGKQTGVPDTLPDDAIVVAHDLSPADMFELSRRRLAGIVTEVGGPTSHTAIVARALSIPAVVAVPGFVTTVGEGDIVIVDGTRGEVLPSPSRMVLARYRGIRRQNELAREELATLRDAPAITLDGHVLRLTANIELDDEAPGAVAAGAEGIGLYRTEYLFLHHRRVPTVAEHTQSYTQLARALGGRRAVVRTYDLGGDKILPGHTRDDTHNPLGVRAIRLAFLEPQVLLTQVEGILRASASGSLAIMLPMVGSVEELRQARAMVDGVKSRLRSENVPFDEDIPLGLMIELPSAVWVADHLARECDFFSIGTNDLIQYTLAVDRQDNRVAGLYMPLHPAILRAVKHTTDAAHAAGIKVSMCGEMAAEPAYAGILLGLGLDELSMPANAIPRVKHTIRHWALADATRLVRECLACATVAEVQEHVTAYQPEVEVHPGALKPSTTGIPSA